MRGPPSRARGERGGSPSGMDGQPPLKVGDGLDEPDSSHPRSSPHDDYRFQPVELYIPYPEVRDFGRPSSAFIEDVGKGPVSEGIAGRNEPLDFLRTQDLLGKISRQITEAPSQS